MRFRAYELPVFVTAITDSHQDVNLRSRINAGECTRNIDLNGGQRNIDRIKFKYEETSWFIGRAEVEIYGE